jgi:uncharacterized integral membrane protein
MPQLIAASETAEEKGPAWVVFAFSLGIALILPFLVGSVIAMLAYRYYAGRLFESKSQPVKS